MGKKNEPGAVETTARLEAENPSVQRKRTAAGKEDGDLKQY